MLIRLPISIFFAAVITLCLYFGMNYLILNTGKETMSKESFKIVDTRIPPEKAELELKDRKPPKPKPPEQPPEPPKLDQMVSNKPSAEATNMNFEFAGTEGIGEGISFDAAADREVLPIVRIEPIYPQRAASRGIEGYVVLKFTVLASGAVDSDSIVIVEAKPEGMFDRAALRAVAKWKYKPKIENGQPVPQHNIGTKLTFRLDN